MIQAFDNRIGYLGGYRVIIVPDVQGVRRTWKERLLTLPWRPWVSTRIVATHWPETLKNGVIKSETEGLMYMRAHTAQLLKNFISEHHDDNCAYVIAAKAIRRADDTAKTCPYCTSDNEAIRGTYYDQTCEGCVKRMGRP